MLIYFHHFKFHFHEITALEAALAQKTGEGNRYKEGRKTY